jgi:hypothetical protein
MLCKRTDVDMSLSRLKVLVAQYRYAKSGKPNIVMV